MLGCVQKTETRNRCSEIATFGRHMHEVVRTMVAPGATVAPVVLRNRASRIRSASIHLRLRNLQCSPHEEVNIHDIGANLNKWQSRERIPI